MPTKDAEAIARAKVVDSTAKVEKLLADIQATLSKLRETTETDGGKA